MVKRPAYRCCLSRIPFSLIVHGFVFQSDVSSGRCILVVIESCYFFAGCYCYSVNKEQSWTARGVSYVNTTVKLHKCYLG